MDKHYRLLSGAIFMALVINLLTQDIKRVGIFKKYSANQAYAVGVTYVDSELEKCV